MGRPLSLTDDLQATVCASLRDGNYLETAAAVAGVTARTLRRWVQQGHDARKRKVRNRYRRFIDAVEQAQAAGEAEHVGTISAARYDHWQASAWWLERTRPERFGRRDKVLVENSVREELDAALDKLERALPPEMMDRVLSALADGSRSDGEDASPGVPDAIEAH